MTHNLSRHSVHLFAGLAMSFGLAFSSTVQAQDPFEYWTTVSVENYRVAPIRNFLSCVHSRLHGTWTTSTVSCYPQVCWCPCCCSPCCCYRPACVSYHSPWIGCDENTSLVGPSATGWDRSSTIYPNPANPQQGKSTTTGLDENSEKGSDPVKSILEQGDSPAPSEEPKANRPIGSPGGEPKLQLSNNPSSRIAHGPVVTTPPQGHELMLELTVPEDAVVMINGRRTRSEGTIRSYVFRNLTPGREYHLDVRASVLRSGTQIECVKRVSESAGKSQAISFAATDFQPLTMTELVVHLPHDAQLTLAGNRAERFGDVRVFSTDELPSGTTWSDYRVVARIERDGQVWTQEQVLDIAAGNTYELKFDFQTGDTRLASR